MTKTEGKKKTEQIRILALEILRAKPADLSTGYTDLCREIQDRDRELNWNTIKTQTYKLLKECDDIGKTSRGHYRIVTSKSRSDAEISLANMEPKDKPKEEDFYRPFAEWLTRDMEDATKAIPLGGKKFGDKWGTPDVIGKRVSKPSDMIEQPIEIVSAEIKTDTKHLITAFGQAVAYCLFSHRSYLVVPQQASDEDLSRLDSLCQAFGLGLVLFNVKNPQDPDFKIRTRPRRQEPDYFYINENMKKIESELFA